MSSPRILLWCAVLIAASFGAAACGDDPPEKEMQQAQGAIDAARAAGAAQYASEELTAAEAALQHAREAVAQRDYRLALNDAIDSRERAQDAAKQAADQKASARADAERALIAASTAITDAKASLKAAESGRGSARPTAQARQTITEAENEVQKARAAIDRGEYRDVPRMLQEPTARLADTLNELEPSGGGAARRRR